MIMIPLNGGGNMPALGLGTWKLYDRECVRTITRALDIGYRHIDTAQIYENEEPVGVALKAAKVDRKELFVTTKLWMNNVGTARVAASAEESLKKLRLDYVDLLLIHWPSAEVPLSETLTAMRKLQEQGKTKAIGVSNFPVALMKQAAEELGAPIACNQVEYHVGLSQRPVLEYARTKNIAITAYSPLGRGDLAKNLILVKIGEKYGKNAGQVALRWLVEQPGVAAIPKSASEENLRRNFEIFDFKLDADDMAQITALGKDRRLISPDWSPRWDIA